MMKYRAYALPLGFVFMLVFCLIGCGESEGPRPPTGGDSQSPWPDQAQMPIKENWLLHSSEGLDATGPEISSTAFQPSGWYEISVPSTVFAALVEAGVYPDPYYGMNLNQVPGSWPPFFDVSLFPMPPGSPFGVPWWYRTEFTLPRGSQDRRVWLRFEGINFRANLWLNGRLLADHRQVVGTFREFEFDITDAVVPTGKNCLAVEVFPPTTHDLAYNWVDWNPTPPDKNMGIYRDVKILFSGPVALRHPQVVSSVEVPGLGRADLTVVVDVIHTGNTPVSGILYGRIEDIRFQQTVSLGPFETKRVTFEPDRFPELRISNPRIWWPSGLGAQELYRIELGFEMAGRVSDTHSFWFGIRDIKAPLTEDGYRLFQINGQNILIRGGAWAPDMLLRSSPERLELELRYALDMGLNTIRLEGKPEVDYFYDLCDKYGIFVMAGWCCCDHWQFQESWDDEDMLVAAESIKNQVYHLRNHPSALVWLNGSDAPPLPEVEQMFINVLEEHHWPNPYLSSADERPSPLTGPSGVKMVGPYEYVPPEYWLLDTRYGGAFGFNTETGPGESIPVVDSLRKFLPPEHYWPIDLYWLYHAGRGWYMTVDPFTRAMKQRYGGAASMEEYAMKAQVLAYDNHRAMFEAYGRNKYRATGVIQWMMNTAWPSLIWHLYDYYLMPGGAYFGAKKALELLHVQYSYDDRSIVVVNSLYEAFPRMKVRARVFDIDLNERYSQEALIDVPPDSSTRVFALPVFRRISTTYFVKLELEDAQGHMVSTNFYWLSTEPVILAWGLTFNERMTPVLHDADMTMLCGLPEVALTAYVRSRYEAPEPGWQRTRIVLENPDATLGFFIELRLMQGRGGDSVVPVYWEDNYFSLFPGERREVSVTYRIDDLHGHTPAVEISGWNVSKMVID